MDFKGCSFQVVSFHLLHPQGRLWCRNQELLGIKAGIHCFLQERAAGKQGTSCFRASAHQTVSLGL